MVQRNIGRDEGAETVNYGAVSYGLGSVGVACVRQLSELENVKQSQMFAAGSRSKHA